MMKTPNVQVWVICASLIAQITCNAGLGLAIRAQLRNCFRQSLSRATPFIPLCPAERGRFAGGSPVAWRKGVGFGLFLARTNSRDAFASPSVPPSEEGSPGVVRSRCRSAASSATGPAGLTQRGQPAGPARPRKRSQGVGAGSTAIHGTEFLGRLSSSPPWCGPFRHFPARLLA
jgi:hypothetical protein